MVQFEKSRYTIAWPGLQLEKVGLPFQSLDKIEENRSWFAFFLLVRHTPFKFFLNVYKNQLSHGNSSNASTQNKFKTTAKNCKLNNKVP